MTDTLTWLNEPPFWEGDARRLTVRTGVKTDFWQRTFYGFVRDDGHLMHREVAGDFTAEVTLDGRFDGLYDQAGLMIRTDARNWVKAGIEATDGAPHFSTVVTRDGFSDWSAQPLPTGARSSLRVRVTRHGEAIRVQYRVAESAPWLFARLGFLAMNDAVRVGMMCCAPEREGVEVGFRDFTVAPPIPRALHDD